MPCCGPNPRDSWKVQECAGAVLTGVDAHLRIRRAPVVLDGRGGAAAIGHLAPADPHAGDHLAGPCRTIPRTGDTRESVHGGTVEGGRSATDGGADARIPRRRARPPQPGALPPAVAADAGEAVVPGRRVELHRLPPGGIDGCATRRFGGERCGREEGRTTGLVWIWSLNGRDLVEHIYGYHVVYLPTSYFIYYSDVCRHPHLLSGHDSGESAMARGRMID